jgi:hypothetical protein
VEVVTSVGVTTAGSAVVVVKMEVAAVRARERVHRRPFTVVIDSWGDAMQAMGSQKETPARLRVVIGRKEIQAPQAPSAYYRRKFGVCSYLTLYIETAERSVSECSKRDRMVVTRWHTMERLDAPETLHAPGAAA